MITRWLTRWADEAARAKVRELQTALEAERAKCRILQTEIDTLAAVVARDRARVQAETARYAKRAAEGR
jgi:hypothetical protein